MIQAPLLGQGVALGWLNVVSHWLCIGALVPATRTGWLCHFVNARGRELSPQATRVRDWLIAELRGEALQVGRKYPTLGIEPLLHMGKAG
ncbi:hypothetical protein [Paenirhodobacter sp.]|uniref:hypothetical protein n=1 Tax=Paenirhodobacter sp. TaxID=1965326 RepID=UPI003B3C0E8C